MADLKILPGRSLTRIELLERALAETLERERADAEEGCSALLNHLFHVFAELRKRPGLNASVSDEMRRAASKLIELSVADVPALSRVLASTRYH